MSAEKYNPEEDSSDDGDDEVPIHPKTDEERALLLESVKNILLFRTLDDEQRMTVTNAMRQMKVDAGESGFGLTSWATIFESNRATSLFI